MGTTISGGYYLNKSGAAHDANGNPVPVINAASAQNEDIPALLVAEEIAPVQVPVNPVATAIFDNKAKTHQGSKK